MSDVLAEWIDSLRAGDEATQQAVWNTYFERLVRMARQRLGPLKRVYDEEDAALSALNSFFAGMEANRFPDLKDQENLWRILFVITVRKIQIQKRKQTTQKRGGGTVRGESLFGERIDSDSHQQGIGDIMGSTPTPDLAMSFAESCQQLLSELPDDVLRDIAIKRLSGLNNAEIAEELGCARRTVDRKLERIRDIWAS